MSNDRKEKLTSEIEEARARLRDNSRAIDAATRQILLDTIRTNKKELEAIDSAERAPSRKILAVNAPTGKSIIAKTNSNAKRIIGSADNLIRFGLR